MFGLFVLCQLIYTIPAGAAFDSATFNNSKAPLQILSINPSGEDIPAGRQIVVHFNRPVVPVGRMERSPAEIPIRIAPSLACEWRWLNTSDLACQLGENNAILPATRYVIEIKPGIKSEDGATIEKTITHTFISERPKVSNYQFRTWRSPGTPVIQVNFNQPVSKDSVIRHLFMSDPGGKRWAVNATEDPEFKKNRKNNNYETGRIWLISTDYELPLDSQITLRVEKGIAPVKGTEPGNEDRVVVAFDTFPPFSFLGIRCTTNNNDQSVIIKPGQKAGNNEFCNPRHDVSLLFSTPVLTSILRDHLKISPALANRASDYDPWENRSNYSQLNRPHVKNQAYELNLPGLLRPYQPYTIQADAQKIKDEFGRSLKINIRQMFFMDHYPPDFSFGHRYSVLEKNVDSELPLLVTNLERIDLTYSLMTAKRKAEKLNKTIAVAKAQDIPYRLPLKIREMIPGSGVVSGSFLTSPRVSNSDNSFFSQITPYNVHVKTGHYNTLVWVTDFASGLGVTGVAVEVYKDIFPGFKPDAAILAKAVTNEDGLATLPGTEKIDPQLLALNHYGEYGENESTEETGSEKLKNQNIFIRCTKGNDMALVPLIPTFTAQYFGDEGGNVYSVMRRRFGHIHTWGTTAQGIYKAGDKVQYKLYVRNQNNSAFVPPPAKGYSLKIIDPMGKIASEVRNITLSKFGTYAAEYVVPKTAAVGWYRFVLSASFHKGQWEPMQVLISDFTPAPFRVLTDLNGKMFKEGDMLNVSTQARLHSGGPYVNAQTRITTTLKPMPFVSEDPSAQGFTFGDTMYNRAGQIIHETKAAGNEKGDLESKFPVKGGDVLYGQLTVESAVRDDRGKYVASAASATYVGRDRFVGVRQAKWVLEKGIPAKIETLVVDEQGKPIADTEVKVQIEHQKTFASRVKGAGNAYLTNFENQWVDASSCAVTSAAAPVTCEFTPENPGYYRITAEIKDTVGRTHATVISSWAVGKGVVVWGSEPTIGLQIVPEKKEYRVGEKARYLIKNPFPGAKALMTIERYGVIKSWVQTLPESTAVVEFNVEPDYVPGYYFSVSVMSPRVDKPLEGSQVDLGKPSFRIGYVEVPVRDPYKEITVKIKPERQIYKPRETVTVDIQAQLREGTAKETHPPMELAVAVLDESVLDLLRGGKSYYDVYRGFYYLDPLDLRNYSLLMQLIGRQKFEKKGANPGGDGGNDLSMRSLFKFVSYWNPSIMTDKDGRARVSFSAPDNLTGWRVLVMAVTPGDRMGLGDANFKVNRATEIRPALPNQVTEGDSFLAGFTIMNRTDKQRTLDVKISAEGPLAKDDELYPRSITQQIVTDPYKRINVWLPVQTAGFGDIKFKVQAWDKNDGDGLELQLPVRKRVSLETAATYGTTTASSVSERIAVPSGIRTDVGTISVVAAPTVIGNMEGAFQYLRDYPYICWEQVLTKGVMASHFQRLAPYLPATMTWPKSKELPDLTLSMASSYQAPNGGMTYYIARDEHVSPYLSAYTGVTFNWLQASGYKIPPNVQQKLHDYLQKLLQNDVMPTFYTKGMSSTVRAVALAALAPHGKVSRADLERYRRHVPEMSLFGKAHYLIALLKVQGTEQLRDEVVQMILAQANETGGKYIFAEKLDSGYDQLLTSTTRDNGAVLSALLAYAETPQGGRITGAIPFKLVRTITQGRGQRDRWENTQENMFCMNALIEYSRLYEKDKPDMTLSALYNGEKIGETSFKGFRDKAAEMERPLNKKDPGKTGTVTIDIKGSGRVYYATRLSYSPLEFAAKPINSGIEVHREYSVERENRWILLKNPMQIKTGELVRVDLFVRLPAARNFVVVDDPVPGGLEPVNRDLATASAVDSRKGDFKAAGGSFWFSYGDWHDYGYSHWSFYHKELRHHAVRFYSEYLPAGNYHLSYVAQAVAPGDFTVIPLHAEEMYNPDVYGKSMPASLKVEKAD